MINPQNQRITKIVELFEQTNLFTADEITLIEDYLSGTIGKEEIEKLDFRDLSAVPADLASKIRGLGMELMNKGSRETGGHPFCRGTILLLRDDAYIQLLCP